MADYLKHVRVLSVDIGPRGSTTPAEGAAAEYIAGEMRKWAGDVRIEPFSCPSTFSWTYALLYLGSVAGGLLHWVHPLASFVIAAASSWLFTRENNCVGQFWRLFPKRPSQNVVGRIGPRGEVRQRVVLVCHHDTSRSAPMFAPKNVKNFRLSFLLMAGSAYLVTLVTGLDLFLGGLPGTGWILIPPILYLAGAVGTAVHREFTGKYTPGANDNASGVSIVLGAGEALAARELDQTEVWLVSTGSEEAGNFGIIHFLDAHGAELKDAWFINLDNVGTGRLKYTTGEGMLTVYPCNPYLVNLAAAVAARHPEWKVEGVTNTIMTTDLGPVLARRFKGISLRTEDADRLLPNWHWHTDVYENVEGETLAIVGAMVLEMVAEIDAHGGEW